MFEDDAAFIAEVATGQASAPGMNPDAELRRLGRRFESFRREFKVPHPGQSCTATGDLLTMLLACDLWKRSLIRDVLTVSYSLLPSPEPNSCSPESATSALHCYLYNPPGG